MNEGSNHRKRANDQTKDTKHNSMMMDDAASK
jgi:hypothetical protein